VGSVEAALWGPKVNRWIRVGMARPAQGKPNRPKVSQ